MLGLLAIAGVSAVITAGLARGLERGTGETLRDGHLVGRPPRPSVTRYPLGCRP